jgi:hypothetical protein
MAEERGGSAAFFWLIIVICAAVLGFAFGFNRGRVATEAGKGVPREPSTVIQKP